MTPSAVIFKITAFLSILGLGLYLAVLENNPDLVRRERYSEQLTSPQLLHARVIIFGDSHADQITEGMLPDGVVNLSFGGDSLKDICLKLEYVLERSNSIRTVILPADYHHFFRYRLVSNNKAYVRIISQQVSFRRLYPSEGSLPLWLEHISRFPAFDNNAYVFTRKKFMTYLRSVFLHKMTAKELDWKKLSEEGRGMRAQRRSHDQFSEGMSPECMRVFEDILRLCQDHNIKVLAVRYPLTVEYRRAMATSELKEVDDFFRKLDGLNLLDLSALIDDPAFFSSADHVNSLGAGITARKILTFLP